MPKIKIKVIIIIFFAGTLIINSCKKADPPAPVINPPEEIQPGSRDYEWTVDTITLKDNYGMTPLRMWASSPNDVWAVGTAYSVIHTIWRFNGEKWKTDSIYRNMSPRGVWGSSKNNVWIGNKEDGSFWHYDGNSLNFFYKTKFDSCYPFTIQWMDGSSEKEIYAVGFCEKNIGQGYRGVIMRFDGIKWAVVEIPIMQISFIKILYNRKFGNYIICGYAFEESGVTLFAFDGKSLKEIFKNTIGGEIDVIGDRVYFSNGKDIFRYENSTFNKILSFNGTNYQCSAIGKSEKDFFTINKDGLGHYNGDNLVTLWKKSKEDLSASYTLCINDEVFSVWQGNRTDTTYFVHGKLKKKGG